MCAVVCNAQTVAQKWQTTGNYSVGQSAYIGTADTTHVSLGVNGKEKMRINNIGQVGIGMANFFSFPTENKFFISDSSNYNTGNPSGYAGIWIRNTSVIHNVARNGTGVGFIGYNPSVVNGAAGGHIIRFYDGGNTMFQIFNEYHNARSYSVTIDSMGNTGIKTTSPTQALQVHGMVYSDTLGYKFPDNSIGKSARNLDTINFNTYVTATSSNYPNGSGLFQINPSQNLVTIGDNDANQNGTTIGILDNSSSEISLTSLHVALITPPPYNGYYGGWGSNYANNITIGSNINIASWTPEDSNNVVFGTSSLMGGNILSNTFNNVSIGSLCGNGGNNPVTQFQFCTFLGSGSGIPTRGQSNILYSNATAIGSAAIVDENDAMVLGNGSVRVGIGTSTPQAFLHVQGNYTTATGVLFKGLVASSVNDSILTVDDSGNVSTRSLDAALSSSVLLAHKIAQNYLVGITSTANLYTGTLPNTANTYEQYVINVNLQVNSATTKTLNTSVTFKDRSNVTQTVRFFPMGLTSVNISVAGVAGYSPLVILAKPNTPITVTTTVVGVTGSINYDGGVTIMQQ